MTYEVRLTPAAERDLKRVSHAMRAQVSEAVRALAANPRPRGIVRIQARPPGYYRIRVRDYRVGFHVDDANHVVRVWLIDRRERFYERAMRRE